MTALDEKKSASHFEPPAAKAYPKQFLDPEKHMTPWRVLPYGINYNNQLLKGGGGAEDFEELLLPKWKGKIRHGQSGYPCDDPAIRVEFGKLLGPKWLKVVEGWAKQEPRVGKALADSIQPLTPGKCRLRSAT